MKRKLALIMAGAMVGTMVPAIPAHAATDNRMSNVVTAKSDDNFGSGGNRTDSPEIKIKNDKLDIKAGETFRINLGEGAEWNFAGVTEGVSTTNSAIYVDNVAGINGGAAKVYPTIVQTSKQRLEVTIPAAAVDKDTDTFVIPMNVKFDGAKGEQKVVIDSNGSGVSGSTLTYAVISEGDTTTTAGTKETIVRGSAQKGSAITIDENTTNTIKAGGQFRVKLPSDFAWELANTTIVGTGRFAGLTFTKGFNNSDDRELLVTVPANAPAGSVRGSIVIKPSLTVKKDAKYGDVTADVLNISADVSDKEVTIADYKDYGVNVKVDKVIDVVGGKEDTNKKVKLIIEETAPGTILSGRPIEITMDKAVAGLTHGGTVKLDRKSGNGPSFAITKEDGLNSTNPGTSVNSTVNLKENGSYKYQVSEFEIATSGNPSTTKAKWEVELPITTTASYEGDVKVKIKGAGISEQEIVVAKAKKPITVDVKKGENAKLADVKIGVQNQEAPEIIITETEKGAIKKGDLLISFNRKQYGNYFEKASNFKVEVLEGDIKIDESATGIPSSSNKQTIKVVVKSDSTKPAKIKISGINVSLDRTTPEGELKLAVSGDFNENGDYKDLGDDAAVFPYVNIITPAPGATKSTTVFKLDDVKYTVTKDGVKEEKAMDVAPFVENGRAMLPVRYVSEALNAQVVWDANSRTATIFKGDRVVQFVLDQNYYVVNGTKVFMDTKTVVKNGRALLPIRYVADALGVNLEWNDTDKTITVQY